MDVILDANSYIQVLHNHGGKFLQTNQFAELLVYLRRTGSRLVVPELTYNEVVARYRDRLKTVTKAARDAWSTLQEVGMKERIDFIEPEIESELVALGELLHHPTTGAQSIIYTDYSGVDVKEVTRRGIGRVRPANDAGEELRDVILWLIVLHYAKQSKARTAFVSGDKTFQGTKGSLHPTLQKDIERAGVSIAFHRSIGDFVKDSALEQEPLDDTALATFVSAEELRGISTEQLLDSRFWWGIVVGAEVSRCEFAEARRYRVGEDSYYIEARYRGEGTIRLLPLTMISNIASNARGIIAPGVSNVLTPYPIPSPSAVFAKPLSLLPPYNELLEMSPEANFNTIYNEPLAPETAEKSYKCSFSLRLSLRIAGGKRESLEVDEFVLLGELTPVTASSP